MPSFNFKTKILIISTTVTLAYVAFAVFDLIHDSRFGVDRLNLFFESGVAILIILGVWKTALFFIQNESESSDKLTELKLQNEAWKRRAAESLAAFDVQLEEQLLQWQLSPAEKQVARMLLKGYSNRDIAKQRKTSEHTTKQQISSIFRKSGLKTRMEISTFFLGDLTGTDLNVEGAHSH